MAGRPRSFDRDEALEVALDTFWRCGYEATSIAGLTKAMGINPPSLYAAFGDKQALFAEAVGRYGERLQAGIADSLDAPTAREGVARLLASAAYFHTEPDRPPGCFVLSEPCLAAERAELHDAVRDRVRRGLEEGDVAPGTDPDALADYVETVLIGMSSRARDGATHAQLAATATLAAAAWPQAPAG